ncbi:uncharacterized protein LOC131673069 [Phymastichus coffea]|uniref:uncharacterized protein LOC131673069 n=1 Tax=Phymastichus coffea TaxID=108790 RepID=UPI00273C6385|nr:uncharacterized protein LOC131673069 [Phymastichus coffea]
MLFQKSLLVGLTVLVVILLNIDQGFALKCYNCDSLSDENCVSNFKSASYQINCTDLKQPWVEFKNNLLNASDPKAHAAFECVEIKELKDVAKNKNIILRTCLPAGLSEKYLKDSFERYNLTLKSANICGKDFCNSSSNIFAGISSLVISIILLFLNK